MITIARICRTLSARRLARAASILPLLFVTVTVGAEPQAPGNDAADRSVWDGVFTEDQSARGRRYYSANCSGCHGADLTGTVEGRSLVGDEFWSSWRETTVDYLLDYASRNMPYSMDGSQEGSLSESLYVDIVAHILARNGLPAGEETLTRESSVGVQIIARDGPGELPSSTLAHMVGCLDRDADGQWLLTNATAPARAGGNFPGVPLDGPLGDREYALMFVLTRLDDFAGYRMEATGLLMGDGGVDGLNVSRIGPIAETCQ